MFLKVNVCTLIAAITGHMLHRDATGFFIPGDRAGRLVLTGFEDVGARIAALFYKISGLMVYVTGRQ
jgi:hypothetical protein